MTTWMVQEWKVYTRRTSAQVRTAAVTSYAEARKAYREAWDAGKPLPEHPTRTRDMDAWQCEIVTSAGRSWGGGSSQRVAVQRAVIYALRGGQS